eukprot:6406813-Amphidinium_carterae.1
MVTCKVCAITLDAFGAQIREKNRRQVLHAYVFESDLLSQVSWKSLANDSWAWSAARWNVQRSSLAGTVLWMSERFNPCVMRNEEQWLNDCTKAAHCNCANGAAILTVSTVRSTIGQALGKASAITAPKPKWVFGVTH